MARRTLVRKPNDRQAANTVNPRVSTEVVANPVDVSVRAVQNPNADLAYRQLAEGLSRFSQGLGSAASDIYRVEAQAAAKEQYERDRLDKMEMLSRADVQAQSDVEAGLDPAQYMSAKSKEADPEYIMAYRQAVGEYQGRKAASAFTEYFQNNFNFSIGTPDEARKMATDWFNEKVQGINDPVFLSRYQQQTGQVVAQVMSQATAYSVKAFQENREDMLHTKAASYITDPNRPSTWVQDMKAERGVWNMRPIEMEVTLWKKTAEAAATTGDVKLLEGFTVDSPDGTPSFAKRFPEEYARVAKQAMASFAAQHKAETQEIGMQKVRAYEGRLRAAKDNLMFSADEAGAMQDELDADLNEQNITPGKHAALSNKIADYQFKRDTMLQHLPALDSGGYQAIPLEKKDKEALFDFKVQQRVAATQDNSPENVERIQTEIALSNRIVAPQHVQRIITGHSSFLPSNAKPEDVTPEMLAGAQTALTYLETDRAAFINGIDKKETQRYYLNIASHMQHSGDGDLRMAILSARQLEQSPVKTEGVQPQLRKVIAEAADEMGLPAGTAEASNWMWDEANYFAERGLALPDKNYLIQKFNASHTKIGEQWVETRNLGRVITEEESKEIHEGLKAVVQQNLLTSGLAKALNFSEDEIVNARIELSPVPSVRSGDASEYKVFVNGKVMLPGSYNLTALRNQYVNKDYFRTYYDKASDVEALIRQAEVTGKVDPKAADEARAWLRMGHESGAITGDTYKSNLDKLQKAQAKEQADVKQAQLDARKNAMLQNSTIKVLSTDPGAEIAAASIPRSIDPDLGSISESIMIQANARNYGVALGMAVFGANTKYFKDGEFGRIGIGYDMDGKTPKELKKDLALVGSNFTMDELVSNKAKLSTDMPGKLFKIQQEKVAPLVKKALTEETYANLPDNQKAVFDVLAMATGSLPYLNNAVEAIGRGAFEEAQQYLVKVPKGRQAAAMSMIRAMAHTPLSFTNLVRRTPK